MFVLIHQRCVNAALWLNRSVIHVELTPVCGISVVGISGSMLVALAPDILGEVCA